mmetsp:Transcript_12627/g.24257  ORF Transcript_12627/g.24257 Transcript_12627/m.24257 type:complete len:286 (+) Transcript_12627:72-929(+)
MIFVWSSSGGPFLQCVSLLLFLVQFLPHLVPQQWGTGALFEAATSLSPTTTRLLAVVAGLAMLAYGLYNNGGSFQRIRELFVQEPAAAVSLVAILMAFTTFVLGSYATDGEFMSLCMVLLQVVGVVMFLHNMTSQIMMMRQQEQQPQHEATNNSRRIHEIVDLVLQLPIEEFVSQDQMASCSVTQLRQMLKARNSGVVPGDTTATPTTTLFVEKHDLVEAVRARRNYNESCCICCEDYQTGDPLRILPKCRHEFHVDCLDKWAYTFANKRNRRDPTCPLCNTPLW